MGWLASWWWELLEPNSRFAWISPSAIMRLSSPRTSITKLVRMRVSPACATDVFAPRGYCAQFQFVSDPREANFSISLSLILGLTRSKDGGPVKDSNGYDLSTHTNTNTWLTLQNPADLRLAADWLQTCLQEHPDWAVHEPSMRPPSSSHLCWGIGRISGCPLILGG